MDVLGESVGGQISVQSNVYEEANGKETDNDNDKFKGNELIDTSFGVAVWQKMKSFVSAGTLGTISSHDKEGYSKVRRSFDQGIVVLLVA